MAAPTISETVAASRRLMACDRLERRCRTCDQEATPWRWAEDAERVDLALYAAIARTPTPTLDVAMSRLSRAADYSLLSLTSAALLALGGGPTGRRAGRLFARPHGRALPRRRAGGRPDRYRTGSAHDTHRLRAHSFTLGDNPAIVRTSRHPPIGMKSRPDLQRALGGNSCHPGDDVWSEACFHGSQRYLEISPGSEGSRMMADIEHALGGAGSLGHSTETSRLTPVTTTRRI